MFEYYNFKGLRDLIKKEDTQHKKAAYYQFVRAFFQHLFATIDEGIIVDSSKYPKRALHLSECLDDYEINYIYIRRNPIGVVRSFAKTDVYIPPKNWFSANIYYLLSNLICVFTLRKLKRKHKVVSIKYEDLASSPEEILDQIGQSFDIDFTALKEVLSKNESLVVGDLFEGNSMRIKERIKLRRDLPSYRPSLPNIVTRLFNLPIYR